MAPRWQPPFPLDINTHPIFDGGRDVWTSKFGEHMYAAPASRGGSPLNDGMTRRSPKASGLQCYDAGAAHITMCQGAPWADGTEGGGAVANGGAWFTTRPLVPPGFRTYRLGTLIDGDPAQSTTFAIQPRTLFSANPFGDRFNPSLWLVGQCYTFQMENLAFDGAPFCPIRLGWDFPRNPDGSLMHTAVLNANRAAGQTVLTTTLQSWDVITLQRTGGVVTLTVSVPNDNFLPFSHQQHVRLVSSPDNVHFPNGTKTTAVLSVRGLTTGQAIVQYTDGLGNFGPTAGVNTKLRTTGVMPRDTLELANAVSAQFVATRYRVLAQSIVDDSTGSITIADPYGGSGGRSASTGDVATPCDYLQEDRGNPQTALYRFNNVSAAVGGNNSPDNLMRGPCVDVGATAAGSWGYFYDCYFGGYVLAPGEGGCFDDDRAAAVLVDGGQLYPATGQFRQLRTTNGGIRIYSASGAIYVVDDLNADNTPGSAAPSAVVIKRGGTFAGGTALLQNIENADSGNQAGAMTNDVDSGCVVVCGGHVYGTQGPHVDLYHQPPPSVENKGFPATGGLGFWTGGVSAYHPGSAELGLPRLARAKSFVPGSASWATSGGLTKTPGQPDPFGGTNAVLLHITSGSGLACNFFDSNTDPYLQTTFTHAVGDRWAMACWVKRVDPNGASGDRISLGSVPQGKLLWDGNDPLAGAATHYGDGGWQLIRTTGTLTHADNSGLSEVLAALTGISSDLLVYEPFLVRVPAGAMTDDEWANYSMTFLPYPSYLSPGIIGTGVGQKLIAHGGYGADESVAVVPSSFVQGALVSYSPLYAADGKKVIGYAPLYERGIPTSPVLWLRADKIAGNTGDLIATWPDFSGNGNDATQGTGVLKPTLRAANLDFNSRNSLHFSGVQYMLGTFNPGSTGFTVAYVMQTDKIASPSLYETCFGSGAGGGTSGIRWGFGGGNATDGIGVGFAGPDTSVSLGDVDSFVQGQVRYQINRYNKITWEGFGMHTFSGVADTTFPGNPYNFVVGKEAASAPTSLALNGDLAEVIVWPRRLDDTEIAQLQTYLIEKYALV